MLGPTRGEQPTVPETAGWAATGSPPQGDPRRSGQLRDVRHGELRGARKCIHQSAEPVRPDLGRLVVDGQSLLLQHREALKELTSRERLGNTSIDVSVPFPDEDIPTHQGGESEEDDDTALQLSGSGVPVLPAAPVSGPRPSPEQAAMLAAYRTTSGSVRVPGHPVTDNLHQLPAGHEIKKYQSEWAKCSPMTGKKRKADISLLTYPFTAGNATI